MQFSKSIGVELNQSITHIHKKGILALEAANCMSQKLPLVIQGACSSICSSIITEAIQVVLCTSQPRNTFDCTASTLLHEQGVAISFKMQVVVSENSGGGQIPTVYHGKAEVFLEMKSITEVQCHILILFFIFLIRKKLFHSVYL